MSDTTKLEALLAELPVHRAPDGWRTRVRTASAAGVPPDIPRAATRRPVWIATGVVLAAAAGIALYMRSGESRAPSIAMHVIRHDHEYRDIASARPGDTIVIRADAAA